MGTPQRAILKRSNARSCFEPHRSRDPAGGRYARKPTNGGRAFWRPPTGPRDATSNPARPHQILIQGIMCESELGCERARGTMTAATVVLVHGMGGSPDAWSRVIPLLDSLGIPNVAVELPS